MSSSFPDTQALLELRRHLSIVHHIPGRIRLRLGPSLWRGTAGLDRDRLNHLLAGLDGIGEVRVNPAVASVAISYDPERIAPKDWLDLLEGDSQAAGDVLDRWLARHGQLLRETFLEEGVGK